MLGLNNKIGLTYVLTSTFICSVIILLILIFMILNSWGAISQNGFQLFTTEWYPSDGKFGILSMLYGSVLVTIISLIIAVPLGVLSAIYISEILSQKYRFYIKYILEILVGIPSIIYGLIGVAFFSVWIENLFDLETGRTILTAGIILSIMIIPTIVTLSDDALQNVPKKYREAARSLGLYQFEEIKDAVLPVAISDIIGAILLALGRALGETMAVMLVIGGIDKIPKSLLNVFVPGQTITSKLGREISESAFGSLNFSSLIFMGLILLLVVLVLNFIVQILFRVEKRLYE